MNRQQVIDLMREAGACYEHPKPNDYAGVVDVFIKFAALVAATEREACAKACDEMAAEWRHSWSYNADSKVTSYELAGAAIRARNTNKEKTNG